VGREVELVVLPNEKRLEFFTQTTERQRKSFCVFNCPRKEEVSAYLSPKRNGDLRILFHGSINYNQPPLLLLDAMAKLGKAVALSVVGYPVRGSRDCMELFQQRARSLDLERNVRYLGALPRYELMKVVKDSHVGLALFPLKTENLNLRHLTGASNKPFDYLACGLALLVSATPDWEEMFVHPGYGLSCDPMDAISIAKCLQWFLDHPDKMREMGECGHQRILKEWNYETQFIEVARKFSDSLEPTAKRVK
jgi:glycosyltransferase involved in cell wall biosynthesis